MSARRTAPRRPRLRSATRRRLGRTCNALAGVLVVGAVGVGVAGLTADDDDGARAPQGPPPTSTEPTGGRLASPTTSTSLPVPRPTTTAGASTGPAGSSAVAASSGRRGNRAPTLASPAVVVVPPTGGTVPGVRVDDAEARPDGEIGVLLVATGGTLDVVLAPGVVPYGDLRSRYLPLIGPLDALRATLATLTFTPEGGGAGRQLVVAVSDFGHGDLDVERIAQRTTTVRVEG